MVFADNSAFSQYKQLYIFKNKQNIYFASANLSEPCHEEPHHKPSHGQYYGSHPHSKTEMSPDSTKTSGDRSPDVLMI